MKKKKIVKDSYIVRTKKRILRDTIETEKKLDNVHILSKYSSMT